MGHDDVINPRHIGDDGNIPNMRHQDAGPIETMTWHVVDVRMDLAMIGPMGSFYKVAVLDRLTIKSLALKE